MNFLLLGFHLFFLVGCEDLGQKDRSDYIAIGTKGTKSDWMNAGSYGSTVNKKFFEVRYTNGHL